MKKLVFLVIITLLAIGTVSAQGAAVGSVMGEGTSRKCRKTYLFHENDTFMTHFLFSYKIFSN